MKRLELDGTSLSLEDLALVARGEPVEVAVAAGAVEPIRASRALVDDRVESGANALITSTLNRGSSADKSAHASSSTHLSSCQSITQLIPTASIQFNIGSRTWVKKLAAH